MTLVMKDPFCSQKNDQRPHPASTPPPLSAIHEKTKNYQSRRVSEAEVTSWGAVPDQKVPIIALQPPSTRESQTSNTSASRVYPKRGYIMDELHLQRPKSDQGNHQKVDVSHPDGGQLITYYRVGDRDNGSIDLLVPFDEVLRYVSAREREEWEGGPERADTAGRIMKKHNRQRERVLEAAEQRPRNVFLEPTKTSDVTERSVTRLLARTLR